MVFIIRKIRGKELYSVKNKETGKIHAHATTKANAKKQVKLLQAIDHGFIPSGNSEDLEGGYFGETLVNAATNLYNRATRSRRRVAPEEDPDAFVDPLFTSMNNFLTNHQGDYRRLRYNLIHNINGVLHEIEEIRRPMNLEYNVAFYLDNNLLRRFIERLNTSPNLVNLPLDADDRRQPIGDNTSQGSNDSRRPSSTGSGRMNSTVKTMITYLQSLYPHKTLISVANEILKLTGHQMSGRGRKSIKASEIAKYVIAAIGTALAIAVALFLLNREEEDDTHLPEDSLIVYARKKIEEDKMKRDELYKNQIAERSRQIQEERQQRGGARLSSVAQNMITYLKSLYPHKTLISVANEILKLTGHQMSGRGRKSTSISSIAKYVIYSIGTVLAIAVAVFLLSDEDKSISQSYIHPRLDKVGPEQKDYYPYPPKPTPKPIQSKPDISLESLYGEQSLPSYTNMNNPAFGKVGRPKKKSDEYPTPSDTFTGNPRGYGRKKRRLRKKKV
jgi:hypothetical protein